MADKHLNPVDFPEVSASGTPAAGFQRVYAKADGLMYARDANGNEHRLSHKKQVLVDGSPAVMAFTEVAGSPGLYDMKVTT